MRKIKFAHLKGNGQWVFPITGQEIPAPFPGKWPTWIAYWVQHQGHEKTVKYLGKPCRMAVERLVAEVQKPHVRRILVYEFDRRNLIGKVNWDVERNPGRAWDLVEHRPIFIRGITFNEQLMTYYHPMIQNYIGRFPPVTSFLWENSIKALVFKTAKGKITRKVYLLRDRIGADEVLNIRLFMRHFHPEPVVPELGF